MGMARAFALAVAAAFLAAPATLAASADDYTITLKETGCVDTPMCFEPANLTVDGGEAVTLNLVNPSENRQPHNLCAQVEGETRCAPGPNDYVQPGDRAQLQFTAPSSAGTITYWCNVPGHRAAGLEGTIHVEASGVQAGVKVNRTGAATGGATPGPTAALTALAVLGTAALVAVGRRREP